MVDLAPETPLAGLLPLAFGDTDLVEAAPPHLTAVLPFAGREEALAEALRQAHGLALPAIGRSTSKAGQRMIWSGHASYLLAGPEPADKTLARAAALVEQSDGTAVMRLEGAAAEAVMMRLTPADLRAGVFKRGHVAACELAHLAAVVLRIPKGFEIFVGRSFARTAVSRLAEAMESVAAQAAM